MECEHDRSTGVAQLYAGRGAPSWNDWNSSSGGQGYWLLGTAALLVVMGVVMMTSKPRGGSMGGY
jgi:hypothetical protein